MNDNCVVDVEFACLKVIYVGILCFCVKLMKIEVVVVELWVNSWLFVVDVVLEHVVDELIMDIPICELVMKIVVVVEKLWKFGELLNFDEMIF